MASAAAATATLTLDCIQPTDDLIQSRNYIYSPKNTPAQQRVCAYIMLWREFTAQNTIGGERVKADEFSSWKFSVVNSSLVVATMQWKYSRYIDPWQARHISLRNFDLYVETAQYWYSRISVQLSYDLAVDYDDDTDTDPTRNIAKLQVFFRAPLNMPL